MHVRRAFRFLLAVFIAWSLVAGHGAIAQVVAKKDRFGDAMELLIPAAAAALTLKRDDGDGFKDLAMTSLVALGSSEVLKKAVHSQRPDGTPNGFPSAHTAIVFSAAGFVHERYGLQWATPFYALATATAYTRVSTHNHFAKDVVGGALVGLGSAYLMTHPFSARTRASLAMGENRSLWLDVNSQW